MKRIYFLLDETGSMSVVRDKTISGFNSYISEVDKKGTRFSLVTFNGMKTERRYSNVKMSEVKPLTLETYQPTSMTPLNDAVMNIIALAESEAKPKDIVLVVILTDGEENASVEYKEVKIVRHAVEEKCAKGWAFTYMGANQDAWLVGQTFGVPKGFSLTYDVNNIQETLRTAAKGTNRYFSGTMSSRGFYHDDEPIKETESTTSTKP